MQLLTKANVYGRIQLVTEASVECIVSIVKCASHEVWIIQEAAQLRLPENFLDTSRRVTHL